jgi:septal ring factor EnvC (AmiA/AmiB activator)
MRWQQILVTCCCLLAIAATAKAFLYLNTEMNTVAKNLNTLQARITVPDTKEQLAAVTAEIKDLKATNTQLRADVKKIRDTLEALRAKKTTLFLRNENGGPSQG